MHTQIWNEGANFCAASIQGNRARQEDHYICRQKDDRIIAVVCDGMGGMQGGDIASHFAAERMAEELEKVKPTESMHGFWKEKLEGLDDGVFALRGGDGSRLRAGTTMVAVLLQEGKLHWFSVGDSRLFFLRGRQMHCVTREHNYAMLAKENTCGRQGEQLISYLGMGTAELFDGSNKSFPTKKGDRLLLCTDGLSRNLKQEELAELLYSGENPEEICDSLRKALEAKRPAKQDNASWVVIEVWG